jgi:ABC-type bacteriocin/lantibiotic exporter with double-glycine peptidase domain
MGRPRVYDVSNPTEDNEMFYQKNEYFCGPAALQNAIAVHIGRVSQDKIAEHTATTEAYGTDEEGMKRAVLALGYRLDEYATDLQVAAWGWVKESLHAGRPCVLCLDHWSHWATLIGICGDRALLFDPSRMAWNIRNNGIHSLRREDLVRRWEAGRNTRGTQPRFYGIAVSKP